MSHAIHAHLKTCRRLVPTRPERNLGQLKITSPGTESETVKAAGNGMGHGETSPLKTLIERLAGLLAVQLKPCHPVGGTFESPLHGIPNGLVIRTCE